MTLVELALIAVFAPLLAAVVLLLAAPLRRTGGPAALVSVTGAGASLLASCWMLAKLVGGTPGAVRSVTWLPEASGALATVGLHVDGTSAVMLTVVALVATCVQVFSLEYLRDEPPADFGRYFAWQSLFLFSMQGLVIAPNLLQLFVCWELVALCSYLLIGYWYRKPSAARAAIKAFWVTKLADVGFLLALLLHWRAAGDFAWSASSIEALAGAGVLSWVAGLYFVGVMGKSAQFPLHVWLPDAMEGPTPVSALLHAATMVAAGVYLLVRAFPLFAAAEVVLPLISVVGGFTALFAACIAVTQTDIKRVLAYSTCSQLGYMVAAIGAGGLFAGYFHLGTHAFFKALLFLAAGSVIHAVHSNDIFHMGGLRTKMPLTTAVFVIGAAALAGLPLLSGFFSKDAILEVLLHATSEQPIYWFPLVACLLTVGLTAYYMARVVFVAFFGEPSAHAEHAHEGGVAMAAPMVLLAAGSIGAGYAGGVLVDLTHHHDAVHFSVTHLSGIGVAGVVLALGGIGLSWWMDLNRGGDAVRAALAPVGRFIEYGAVDRAYEAVWRQGLLLGSRGVAWIDRYVVDGLMNVVGAGSLLGGQALRRIQTGRPADYVLAVVIGTVVLVVWTQMRPGGVGWPLLLGAGG